MLVVLRRIKKTSDAIIAEERKSNIILRYVPKSYHGKANIVYDVIKDQFDNEDQIGRCVDYLVSSKTIINPLYVASLAEVMKMESLKRVIAPKRYRFLANVIQESKDNDDDVGGGSAAGTNNNNSQRMDFDNVFDDAGWVL
jgi:hypothetical protein